MDDLIREFGEHSAKAMCERKQLKLSEDNEENFDEKPIEIKLNVKNIQKVSVNIYTVDLINFYKHNSNSTEPDHTMNLDGLIPKFSQQYSYA